MILALSNFGNYAFNIHSVPIVLVAFLVLGMGIFILAKNPKRQGNLSFFLTYLSAAIWLFATAIGLLSTKENIAIFWFKIDNFGVMFISVSVYYFVCSFLGLKNNNDIKIGYAVAFILAILTISTDLLVVGAKKHSWGYFPLWGILAYPVLIFFFGFMLASFVHLSIEYRKRASPLEKNQIRYLFVAFMGAYTGSVDYLPVLDIAEVYPFGYISVTVFLSVVAYTIVRYRLLDIRIAITRATAFLVVYAVVLGIPFVFGYRLRGRELWYVPLLIAIVLASGGPFIYTTIRRRAENRLRREEFLAHKALNRLAQDMMRFTKLQTLLKLIVRQVVRIMGVNFAAIYLRDEGNKRYHLRATRSINNTLPEQTDFLEDSPLIKDILLRTVPMVTEELKFGRISNTPSYLEETQTELQKSKAAVIIPAFKGDELFGFLMLGSRKDNRIFTQEDLNLLSLLATQAVFAIENAKLVEKDKSLLAEKSRRDALADMAPGVAHQFDNRLQSISFTAEAQMLLNQQQDLKKLNPDELISVIEQGQKAFDSIAKDAIRGKEISDAVKNKGRAKLTLERQALLPIIQGAINRLRISRTKESLRGALEPEITIDSEEGLPELFLQQSQTDDVFYNLLDNARDAIILRYLLLKDNTFPEDNKTSYQGKITIKAFQKDEKVIVTVSDNGIGMKEKQLKRLFVPWFTTKATSIKGAGMGLSAIEAVIEEQKGKINAESEYGKGTTFTIEFPISPAIKTEANHDKKAPDS